MGLLSQVLFDGGGEGAPVFLAFHFTHAVEDAELGLGGGLFGGHGLQALVAENHIWGDVACLGKGFSHVAQPLKKFVVHDLGRARNLQFGNRFFLDGFKLAFLDVAPLVSVELYRLPAVKYFVAELGDF